MKIQISKMIIYGIIGTIFYIILPIFLFNTLSTYNIITFSETFIMSTIIMGVIGVIILVLGKAFPKDTIVNRLIALTSTIYTAFYLFYIFGGFDPSRRLGTYYVNMAHVQILLGLKIIAWLLLISVIINSLQYVIEAIEIQKQKEYNVNVKKPVKVSILFKVLGIIMSLVITGYLISIIASGANLRFNLNEDFDPTYDYNETQSDFSDDSLNITASFDVKNNGIYSINDVYLKFEIFTDTTDNSSILPENTLIGESENVRYFEFKALTITSDKKINVVMNPLYIQGLATTDASLEFKISFSAIYAGVFVDLNASINVPWTSLIP